jgi:hypothetical protein
LRWRERSTDRWCFWAKVHRAPSSTEGREDVRRSQRTRLLQAVQLQAKLIIGSVFSRQKYARAPKPKPTLVEGAGSQTRGQPLSIKYLSASKLPLLAASCTASPFQEPEKFVSFEWNQHASGLTPLRPQFSDQFNVVDLCGEFNSYRGRWLGLL